MSTGPHKTPQRAEFFALQQHPSSTSPEAIETCWEDGLPREVKDIRVLPSTRLSLCNRLYRRLSRVLEHDPLAEADDLDALGTLPEVLGCS